MSRRKRKQAPAEADDSLVTIEQAQARLGCGRSTIYVLVKEGRLELVKIRGMARITKRSVKKVIADAMRQATPADAE